MLRPALADAPISCESCPVGRHAIYAPTFIETPQRITERRHAKLNLPARRIILREGEVPARVFTLFSGWACRTKTLPDGSCQILSFYIPGDFVTVQAISTEPLAFSVRSVTDVALCAFDRTAFVDFLLNNEELRLSLCQDVLAQYDRVDRTLADVGRRPAIGRVAAFLLSIEERLRARGLSTDGHFELPVPQALIADSLGLTTVHVNRTLAQIREMGAIDFSRNAMRIVNAVALEQLIEGG